MDTDRESGILDTVPSQFIVRAMYLLPSPDGTLPSERSVELFVPHVGLVRLTFRMARRGGALSSHWCWSAKSADLVPAKA